MRSDVRRFGHTKLHFLVAVGRKIHLLSIQYDAQCVPGQVGHQGECEEKGCSRDSGKVVSLIWNIGIKGLDFLSPQQFSYLVDGWPPSLITSP